MHQSTARARGESSLSMNPSTRAPAAWSFSTAAHISSVVPVTDEMTTKVRSPTRRSPVVLYSAALRANTSMALRSFMCTVV